jgi:uncharacterized repeat protein (TIGR03803 family)
MPPFGKSSGRRSSGPIGIARLRPGFVRDDNPFGSVIRDLAGDLYGAAYSGGDTTDPQCAAAGGCGVVFKLDPRGQYSVLPTFKGGTGGANPQASLNLDLLGNLYGTTTTGGDPTCNCGTVFKIALR